MLTMTTLVVWYCQEGGYGPIGISGRMALLLLLGNILVLALAMVISRLIPAAPETNRRVLVEGSRFNKRPVAPVAPSNGSSATPATAP